MKPVYISGISALSSQQTFRSRRLPENLLVSQNNRMRCIEPNYSDYLNPVMARRMGRIIKMGIATAIECLKDAGVEMPGAIITGTALGCLGDTEKFLTQVIRDDEQFLTPTHFIQSLQNTVSAQIALHLRCMNHNFTFVHKGFSFESALLDAMMLINEKEADHVLTGGLDEMTDHNHHIYNRLGIWKKENIASDELYRHPTPGTIAGEGAAFFVLNEFPSGNDYGALEDVRMIYAPQSESQVASVIDTMSSSKYNIRKEDCMILWGFNGDASSDAFLERVKKEAGPGFTNANFKHLCGEYQTSSSFALWMAANILRNQTIPEYLDADQKNATAPGTIIICNNYGNNFSLIKISAVK